MEDDVIFCHGCYDRVGSFSGGELSANGRYGVFVNKCIDVEKQYLCKDCNKSLVVEPEHINKNHCYMKETVLQELNIGLIDHMSYEKMSEIIELMYGHAPVRQTILNHVEKNEEEFLEKEEKKLEKALKKAGIKLSSVYHYDEQYIFINGKLYIRLVILDNKTNMIIAKYIIPSIEFNKNFVERFLKSNLDGLPFKGMVTDDVNYYQEIIDNFWNRTPIMQFSQNEKPNGLIVQYLFFDNIYIVLKPCIIYEKKL